MAQLPEASFWCEEQRWPHVAAPRPAAKPLAKPFPLSFPLASVLLNVKMPSILDKTASAAPAANPLHSSPTRSLSPFSFFVFFWDFQDSIQWFPPCVVTTGNPQNLKIEDRLKTPSMEEVGKTDERDT